MPVFCSKTQIFAPEYSNISCRTDPPNNLRFQRLQVAPVARGFSFSTCSKAFATYLKPYWKPWKAHCIMLELTHYLREYVSEKVTICIM